MNHLKLATFPADVTSPIGHPMRGGLRKLPGTTMSNILTQNWLPNRRHFLRGLCAVIALPVLWAGASTIRFENEDQSPARAKVTVMLEGQ
ncbi:MAG: hypothetical protein A2107_09730 [Verrucomicrobia bacterium GWF2_62_7]|nr:MAG: hypothetical protein A2107_09730 [Verrucomicrobia bacterium GWF2_62_7]